MLKHRPPYFGAAYYPEDWPETEMDKDIAAMKEANMNVMRIAEFAWSRMEPRDSEYDFEWLHKVVDRLAENGIATIMCTPTATPPAWLSVKHPEILVQFENGVRAQHGARRHACPTSPVYREYCEKITVKMREEFAGNENIIGWQIDNELYIPGSGKPKSSGGCFCKYCVDGFHAWLKERFGTIEKLNDAWCLNLWSQSYDCFADVPAPRGDTWHHPSLKTAWMEFMSDAYVDFCNFQADLLHQNTDVPVGTDMMPFLGLSYEKIHRKLDLVQFNHYNSMDNLWQAAFWMDYIRPIKDHPFWNTETATCWNGSVAANGYRDPGFCRVNSWLPFAQGGEANLYWLWRSHWSGQELMHGSVLSSCGRPLHIFDEVKEIGQGLKDTGEFLNRTRPDKTALALHASHLAWWTFDSQPIDWSFGYMGKLLETVYHPLIKNQLRPDVIDPAMDLAGYRMLISPYLPAIEEGGLRERLWKWIEDGGTWIAGPFTDIRDLNGSKFRHSPFGWLEDWCKVYCKYELPSNQPFEVECVRGNVFEGSVWYSGFEAKSAEVMATYKNGPLEGLAAITRTKIGKGQIILLGTMPPEDVFGEMVKLLGEECGVNPVAEAGENLLVVPRKGDGGEGLILVELKNQPASITLEKSGVDLISGKEVSGQIQLEPYTVMVIRYN